jgi:hypothetical protein
MNAHEVEILRATIRRLDADGWRPIAIARQVGCSTSSVYRTLASTASRDGRRSAQPAGRDPPPAASSSYLGISEADRAAAAAADPVSLRSEIVLLRGLIHSLEVRVSAPAGDDQSRFALIRLIRDLTDSLARLFRASQAVPASDPSANLDALGDAAEIILSGGQTDGTHDAPPARQADDLGA